MQPSVPSMGALYYLRGRQELLRDSALRCDCARPTIANSNSTLLAGFLMAVKQLIVWNCNLVKMLY